MSREPTTNSKSTTLWLATVLVVLSGLTIWSAHQWNHAWVERSAKFFPAELIAPSALDEAAWNYPVYRSNDTYQWVYSADELARGNPQSLRHRDNEGPNEGRPHAWSSILARCLYWGGSLNAKLHDWPIIRGIHDLTHWFGPLCFIAFVASAAQLIRRINPETSPTLTATLLFFVPTISWDFAFSRTDHEILFQFCWLFQFTALLSLSRRQTRQPFFLGLTGWSRCRPRVVARIDCSSSLGHTHPTGLPGWQRTRQKEQTALLRDPWLIWGMTACAIILLALILDQRFPVGTSINALHPIYLLAQLGASLICAIGLRPASTARASLLGLGLLMGLCPALWIWLKKGDAHLWFDPLQKRFHDSIVEMQSPFSNGLWQSNETLILLLLLILALVCINWQKSEQRAAALAVIGLGALAFLQTRWQGLAATAATLSVLFSIQTASEKESQWRMLTARYSSLLLCSGLFILWGMHWRKLPEKPSQQFLIDFYVQVAGRDLNLNLQALNQTDSSPVLLPMSYATASTLYPKVHPLGTFYWENDIGLGDACRIYAADKHADAFSLINQHAIQFIAVSRLQLGIPHANLSNTIANGADQPPLESTFAWQLSFADNLPEWIEEIPYYGSIDPRVYSARLYRTIRAESE